MGEADVKEAFDLFDRSGSGSVSFEDFGTVVRAVGHNPTEAELAGCGSGNQDFAKVMAFVKQMDEKPKADIEGRIIDAFKVFDADSSGTITAADLKHVMTSIGEKLTAEQAEQMMTEADIDGSGKLNYEEFVKNMMTK